jgi:serine protease AprX
MNRSISTINADIAQTEFGARGQGIVWAVVSTGVESSHPHFKPHRSLSLPDGLSHWDFSDVDARARRLGVHVYSDVALQADVELGRRLRVAVDADGHGTSVAAVIAGESRTDYGELLRGMAPECKLLSINLARKDGSITELEIIAALKSLQAMNAKTPGEIANSPRSPVVCARSHGARSEADFSI